MLLCSRVNRQTYNHELASHHVTSVLHDAVVGIYCSTKQQTAIPYGIIDHRPSLRFHFTQACGQSTDNYFSN